jgi:uncharacterized protein DUF2637
MSSYSPGRGPRPADLDPRLRLAALSAVILGVALLAAAAFALSYAGIHEIALRAGVTPGLARLYPPIFDATLVIAATAALSLRGAGWWPQGYAWFSLLLMLAAAATGDALHATNVTLPAQPTRALVAVTPWVLLLLAFGLLLEMLRHFRRVRMASALQARSAGPGARTAGPAARTAGAVTTTEGAVTTTGGAVTTTEGPASQERARQAASGGSGDPGDPGDPGAGNGAAGVAQRTAVTWANAPGAGEGRPLPQPRPGLDSLFGPKEGAPPAITASAPAGFVATKPEGYPGQAGQHDAGPHDTSQHAAGQGQAGQHPDPVSYGEKPGYDHPESYQDHGGHPDYPLEGTPPPAEHPAAEHPAAEHPAAEHPAAEHPAAEHPAADSAEPGPAPEQTAPGPDAGAAAAAPEPAATPTLDRLRSTPAPPEE